MNPISTPEHAGPGIKPDTGGSEAAVENSNRIEDNPGEKTENDQTQIAPAPSMTSPTESLKEVHPNTSPKSSITGEKIENLTERTSDPACKKSLRGMCNLLNGMSEGDRLWTLSTHISPSNKNTGSERFGYRGRSVYYLAITKFNGVSVMTNLEYIPALQEASVSLAPCSYRGTKKVEILGGLEAIEKASRIIANGIDEGRFRDPRVRTRARPRTFEGGSV